MPEILLLLAAMLCGAEDAVGVNVGESVVISKSDEVRQWFPSMMQLASGDLVASVQRAADEINPDAIQSLHLLSKDGGKTWSEPQVWKENGNSWTRLRDGSCIWLSYLVTHKNESAGGIRVGRSSDGVEYSWSDGTLDVAPNKLNQGTKGTATLYVHRSIVEMPGNTLLATVYGRFAGDVLDRTIVVSSTDAGATWKYLSTIGYDPNVGGEGLNEPCMIRLANGDLFCFMRNESGKPMYLARSADGGTTWSAPLRMPEEYARLSVDPDLRLLSDGVLACSAGRPDCHLMFSLDGTGKTWTQPITVFSGPSTCYTSIVEIEPGRLFYLHDVIPAGWREPKKGEFHEIRGVFLGLSHTQAEDGKPAPDYEIQLTTPREEFDGTFCWFHPRVAAIPSAGEDGAPRILMTLQKHLLPGDDYYSGLLTMRSDDLGTTWTDPKPQPELGWRSEPDGITWAVCDVTPGWHAPTEKVIAIGHTVRYKDGVIAPAPRPRETAYAVYDPKTDVWNTWKLLEMPDPEKFYNAGAGCTQWLVEGDGSLLVPIYVTPKSADPNACSMTTVVRCGFDGTTLSYVDHGDEIVLNVPRGCDEPSLTRFRGKYYLTIRNDQRGYVTVGEDGLHFAPIKPWTFDDGEELGSYNTQQHWVTHSDGLFLAYTRRGANNDEVFRHRAPLFIGQVDPDRLCIIRASERILMPNRGATLGNFGVCRVSDNETWVTDAEGMFFPEVYKKYGAKGAIFAARVIWNTPNGL